MTKFSMVTLKCKKKNCKGNLVSLYYKVNNQWHTVPNKKICTTCESIHNINIEIQS